MVALNYLLKIRSEARQVGRSETERDIPYSDSERDRHGSVRIR